MQDPILTPIFTTLLVEAGLAATITNAGFTVAGVAQVLSTATLVAGSVALNYALSPGAPKPQDGLIPFQQPIPSRVAGFGEVRLAPSYLLYESINGSSYDILGICQGPVGGFKQFYLDDLLMETIKNDVLFVHPVDVVQQHEESKGYGPGTVFIQTRRGEALETAIRWPELDGIWTDDHRGDRLAQLYLKCLGVKRETFPKVYPHGLPKPSVVPFLPCWDFRDTNQDADDPDTWVDYFQYDTATNYAAGSRVLHGGIDLAEAPNIGGMLWLCLQNGTLNVEPGTNALRWVAVWKNPVLQAVTYLISQDIGMGLPRSRIIDPVLAALTIEAAKCDAPVLRKDGSREPRYASSTWFKLDTRPEEVLGQIFGSCDGWVGLDGSGQLVVKVGVYATPTVTLDDTIITGVDVAYAVGDEERIDEIALSFTSPDHEYTTQSIAPLRNEAAIFSRGKIRSEAFGPASVHSHSQVARLGKRILQRAVAKRGTITTNLGGLIAAGHRYVAIDYHNLPELDGVVVELRSRKTSFSDRQCSFDFVIIDPATVDAWNPATEEPDAPPNPDKLDRSLLPVPANLGYEAFGDPLSRVDLSWDDPGRDDLTYIVRFRVADEDGPWAQQFFGSPTILDDRVIVTLHPPTEEVYEMQVVSVGSKGSTSEWSDSIFVDTALPSLDFSHAQNSQYIGAVM